MASAEILRIIDVGADAQAPAPAPVVPGPAPRARGVHETQKLALWPGPTRTEAIVTQGEPVPLIHVERVQPRMLDPRIVFLRDPTSESARSFRLLRHRLLGMGDPRTIAVTSARPEEGKTTCALNLAFALAEDTLAQVLFMEANLHRPVAGRLFGFEPYQSLLGVLVRTGDVVPPYPVAAIDGTRLHVAALSSKPIRNARLDRTLFASILSDLREVYDYVVVDAGSVLESGDADIAGECASGAILTVRAGKSRRQDVRHALDQLRPTPVLGTVLFDS